MNLPEDMRISKLLRRLAAERDPNNALDLCEKLKIVIVDSSNAAYIRRSFDILAESIWTILKEGPEECLHSVAIIFGMMGFVLRNDFPQYRNWIVKIYKNHHLRIPMMTALLKTFKLDFGIGKHELRDHSSRIIDMLKDYLENAESPDLFIAITNTIQQFSINYPKTFEPHFTDIVDIVVGWHLETDQTIELKQHCSEILQSFNRFWAKDNNFTVSLLGQFLADIIVCLDELQTNADRESPVADKSSQPELFFAALVGAYNSVLKCSFESSERLVQIIGADFLSNSFERITSVAQQVLHNNHSPEVIININEFIVIFINCLSFNVKLPFANVFGVIDIELEKICSFTKMQTLTLLFVILHLLTELKSNIPFELIQKLLGGESNLSKLKFSKSKEIYVALIKIYHAVLDIKNVSILQEAYKHILIDLGTTMKTLPPLKNDSTFQWPVEVSGAKLYSVEQAEYSITFYLTAISELAISSSSIIAMWALQPSILELLANDLRTTDYTIWINHRSVHFAIIKLLSEHCRRSNNFILSSSLLNIESNKISEVFNKLSLESTATSPTTQHFSLILTFFKRFLSSGQWCEENCTIILDWCQQLLGQTSLYADILKEDNTFTAILQSIATISTKSSDVVKLNCANCIDQLDQFGKINLDIHTTIAEICCIHMCSTNVAIRQRYSIIFSKLPLNVTLKQVNEYSGLAKERAKHISNYQHWHTTHQNNGEIHPRYFKNLIERISFDQNAELCETMLIEMFTNCSYAEEGGQAGQFCKWALTDLRCLISWVQWESAQHCVNNKLRTALGKPQDTFLRIESIIKENARILAMKEKSVVKNVDALVANQKHTRILLGFMEALEKAIYNASMGTAFALPLPEKPARTFFHVNAPTCNEWFSRIRTAVDLVALHCMEPEMVIRYSEMVLKYLASTGKTNEPLFEHTLMSHAWALLRNGESDALYGLYVWTKAVANRKFVWVKLAAG